MTESDLYNPFDDAEKSQIGFFYDSFLCNDDYLIFLDNVTNGTFKCESGYKYVCFSGRLLYTSASSMYDPNYLFYFARDSFIRSFTQSISRSGFNKTDKLSLFLWLVKSSRRKLNFNFHKLLLRGSFDYEIEKARFIQDCVNQGLIVKGSKLDQ